MSITIHALSHSYGADTPVLQGIDLRIKKGSLFGLLGPNGAGKTTLVSILNTLVKKDSGRVEVCGYDLDSQVQKVKACSGYVPQGYAFYPQLNARENLEFFAALHGLQGARMRRRIEYAIEATALEQKALQRAYTYSGGLKRRLNIAIGLLNDPRVLYLDEPTVGIDPQSRHYILEVIKKINRRKQTTIVYTSHYMEEIEYLCDEVAILDGGKVLLQSSVSELTKAGRAATLTLSGQPAQACEGVRYEKRRAYVDLSRGYDTLRRFLNLLEKERIEVLDMQSGRGDLEQFFLQVTSERLRDG